MLTQKDKAGISARALIQRINRKLLPDDERVRVCKESSRWYADLGRFFRVDLAHNAVVEKDLDLEKLGREQGVLAAWERLAE